MLSEVKAAGDSVKLQWTRLDNSNFVNYSVTRRTLDDTYATSIHRQFNNSAVAFVDNTVPYTATVDYQVVAQLTNGQTVYSNIVSYQRPNIRTVAVAPFDVQFQPTGRLLYFFEQSGKILKYDLASERVLTSLATGATIGYSDFATYGGHEELYVPRNDGWVFIYDAATLTKIDQLSVGSAASCVVANNGLLFVSNSAWTNRPLKVYNRATKQLVAETGDFDRTRFKRIPNTNTELLEITLNIGPTDQNYYSFGPTGTFQGFSNDTYHGDHPLDATIFEFFPGADRYITSTYGAIYRRNMIYETTLPRGNKEFTTFGFDAGAQLIYAGTRTRSVEVYTMNGYSHSRTIPTKAYPYRLFKDPNGGFICVSSVGALGPYAPAAAGITIEYIK
ncbi:hypothetical protein [Hymenobacter sp. UYP22]|uniref:YncE family protein n=1 Tax=Hymenobacter sp. UYP22 TaxID=3156348 RepID=UPI003393DF70